MPAVLVIGGTDSSGGAGLSRDLRVLTDCDVLGVPVVTGVTAQTHAAVHSMHAVPPEVVREQISAALESNVILAIKIGMLGARATVEAVARSLPVNDAVPIVLDPVLVASSGKALVDDSGREAMRELLLPNVTLLTPNIPEAAALLDAAASHGATATHECVSCEAALHDEATLVDLAQRLRALGPQAVLVKGGHGSGEHCVDILSCDDGEIVRLSARRLPVTMRGTGCALASAIAAGLARGLPLPYACRFGKHYLLNQFQARAAGG